MRRRWETARLKTEQDFNKNNLSMKMESINTYFMFELIKDVEYYVMKLWK